MKKILFILLSTLLFACDVSSGPASKPDNKISLLNWPGDIKVANNFSYAQNLYTANVLYLVDTSGSMGQNCDGKEKMSQAIEASRNFLNLIPDNTNIGIIRFGGRAEIVRNFTSDKNQILSGINSLRDSGGTPMDQALALADTMLRTQAKAQKGNGAYHIVILGDGDPDYVDNTNSWLDFFIKNTPVQIHSIGLCANLSVMKRPGMDFKTVNSTDQLSKAFASVLGELDNKQGDNQQVDW